MIELNKHKMKTDRAWDRLYSRLDADNLLVTVEKKPKAISLNRYGAVAAVAAVIVCLAYGVTWYLSQEKGDELMNLVVQENKETSVLVTTLEDGSVVYLTQQALLQYPEHFATDKREVNLQGDAYFDIAPDRECPFWIETGKVRIKVVGTAFDVRTDGKSSFSLSVQRGKVQVLSKQNGQDVYVEAGETVTWEGEQPEISRQQDAIMFERYWNHIRFKDERLGNILRVMNQNSTGPQIQTSAALEERKLTVEFAHNSPESVAELIGQALGLKCTRQEGVIKLSE